MSQGRKFSPFSILLVMFVGLPLLTVASWIAYSAFQARRPNDLPNAIWIDAPAVPLGFYRGWWEGCWLERDGRTDHCRLSARDLNPPVVYEGRFVPCDGGAPIPTNELKLRTPHDSAHMWIFPRFLVFLKDGRILVPVENLGDCSKIREHLQNEAELEQTN